MLRHSGLRRTTTRVLVAATATVTTLLATLGATPTASADPSPAPTTTTIAISPGPVTIGQTVTLTATVTSADAPVSGGQVSFDLAPSQAAQWGADSPPAPTATDVSVGPFAVGPTGVVSAPVTLSTVDYPFLHAGTTFYVAAVYSPYDPGALEPHPYQVSTSASLAVADPRPAVPPTATAVSLGQPGRMVWADHTTAFTAHVTPASAPGAIQLSVDGVPVGSPTPVQAGSATVSASVSTGWHEVSATFTPTSPAMYAASATTVRAFGSAKPIPTIGSDLGDAGIRYLPAGERQYLYFTVDLPSGVDAADLGNAVVSIDGTEHPMLVSGKYLVAADPVTFTKGQHTVVVYLVATDPRLGNTFADFTVVAAPRVGIGTSIEATGTTAHPRIRVTARVTAADGHVPQGTVQFGGSYWSGINRAYVMDGLVGTPVRLVGGVARAEFPASALRYERFENLLYVGAVFTPDDRVADYEATSPNPLGTSNLVWDKTVDQDSSAPAYSSIELSGKNCLGGPTTAAVTMRALGDLWASGSAVVRDAEGCTAGGASRAARTGTRTIPLKCAPSPTGYSCPLGDLPAGTAFTIKLSYPLPAASAGKTIPVTGSVTTVNPATGQLVTLASKQVRVSVPKRTMLSATLAPAKKGLVSARPGATVAYRATLKNTGVVSTTNVRACVTVARGAQVKSAKGLVVRGTKACWTIPALKGGRTVARVVTVVTPRKKAPLAVTFAATPAKTQASPVVVRSSLTVQ